MCLFGVNKLDVNEISRNILKLRLDCDVILLFIYINKYIKFLSKI